MKIDLILCFLVKFYNFTATERVIGIKLIYGSVKRKFGILFESCAFLVV